MNRCISIAGSGVALAAGLFAMLPTGALAQAPSAMPSANDWKFAASVYGYLPSVGGDTSFPA